MSWTEERASFRSDDLPRFLRLSRLKQALAAFCVSERITANVLVEDLVAVIAEAKHGQPLPGNPNRID